MRLSDSFISVAIQRAMNQVFRKASLALGERKSLQAHVHCIVGLGTACASRPDTVALTRHGGKA